MRRGHRADGIRITKAFSLYTKEDIEILAYYFFCLTCNVDNTSISDNSDFYRILRTLVENTKKEERFQQVISTYIEYLKENALLIENADGLGYMQDAEKFRFCDFASHSVNEHNYMRVLYADNRKMYSQFMYHIFLSEEAFVPSKMYYEVPSEIIKRVQESKETKFLKKHAGLSKNECAFLAYRYRKELYSPLHFIDKECDLSDFEMAEMLLGFDKPTYDSITNSNSRLRQFGFLDKGLELSPSIMECISNQDFSLYFSCLIKPLDVSAAFELESFSVPEENTKLFSSLLKSEEPVSFLLYGAPGSGKTEYAKALVKAAGKEAKIFRNENENFEKDECLFRLNYLLSETKDSEILIVDEADSILRSKNMSLFGAVDIPASTKGVINRMLEKNQRKVIWIVNYYQTMDVSTLRRFTLSYRFSPMSSMQLKKITRSKLEKLKLSDELKNQIVEKISSYKLCGSSVENVAKVINTFKGQTEAQLLKSIDVLLKENSQLLNKSFKPHRKISSNYEPSVLNTDFDSEKLLRMLRNAQKYDDNGIRLLFYGLSGSGKSEFARYISEQLGKPLLIKKASDILNKYVGGTEEKISDAFREAGDNDMLLLFDEADTFFADRESAQHSWERTQVNEFLTQLDEFKGIVICTTNLRNIMDKAMLRRFDFTIKFKAMEQKGIETLLQKYFPSYDFSERQISKLAAYKSITPGDFGRLNGKIRFMDKDEISADLICHELCNIQKEKDGDKEDFERQIGFAS